MKKCIIVLSILLSSCYTYQKVPVTMEPIDRTITVAGDKNELYIKANSWMVENFVSSKSVIQFSDKEAGIVSGRYLFKDFGSVSLPMGQLYDLGEIYAIIKIQVKDGASKITMNVEDFIEIRSQANENHRYTKENAIQEIKDLMDKYEHYLKTTDNSF